MLKFLLLPLAIFLLYKLFANDFLHKGKKNEKIQQKENEKRAEAGELVKDPICGTYVSLDDSITIRDGEAVHHFCSYECRDKFLKQLEKTGRGITGNKKDE
jgi:YHS domain-containing protein